MTFSTLSLNSSLAELQLIEEIGFGNQSEVFKAVKDGRLYALKIGRAQSKNFPEFRREAVLLARARSPYLAEIFEVGINDNRPYMIMEYIEGQPLAQLIRKKRFSEQQTSDLGISLARALMAVHKLGLIHRDIKPENVLVKPDGQFKLIDFGLASLADNKDISDENCGTIFYSSPEQLGTIQRPVDVRSDLYSLGLVLFEALTGQLPFKTDSINSFLESQMSSSPEDIKQQLLSLSSKGPSYFIPIIVKLLARDPDDRFHSATDLVEALERTKSSGPAFLRHAAWKKESNAIAFVGREGELKNLIESLDRSKQFGCEVTIIQGEAGLGKTRLVREALFQARLSGFTVLQGKCSEDAQAVPLVPFRQAIDDFASNLAMLPDGELSHWKEKLNAVPSEQLAVLASYSKRLRGLLNLDQEVTAAKTLEQAANSLVDALLALGKLQNGLALFIDDIQWSDQFSRSILRKLRIVGRTESLFIVLVSRESLDSNQPNEQNLSEFLGTTNVLKLSGLDRASVHSFISHVLGSSQFDERLIELLLSRCDGRPLLLEEYLRAMLENGLLLPSWGFWKLDTQGLADLDLPKDARELIQRNLNELSLECKQLLKTAALIGGRFDAELLRVASQLPELECLALLQEAVAKKVIERTDSREYCFLHDKIREALSSDISPSRVPVLNLQIAEALECKPTKQTLEIYALARHFLAAQSVCPPGRVFEALYTAALSALDTYAFEEAFNFLHSAEVLAISHDLRVSAEFQEQLASVCVHLGRMDQAVEKYSSLLRETKDPFERARLRTALAQLHETAAQTLLAWKEISMAFEEIGRPTEKAGVLFTLKSLVLLGIGLISIHTGLGFGKAKAQSRRRFQILASLYEMTSVLAFLRVQPIWYLRSGFRMIYCASRLGQGPELVAALSTFSVVMALVGLKKMCFYYIHRAQKLAQVLGNPTAIAHLKFLKGIELSMLGNETGADAEHRNLLQNFVRWCKIEDFVHASACQASSLLMRGFAIEAFETTQTGMERLKDLERQNKAAGRGLMMWLERYALSSLSMLGDFVRAESYRKSIEARLTPQDIYHAGTFASALGLYYLEQEESLEAIDMLIANHQRLRISAKRSSLYLRHFFVIKTYLRIYQWRKSPSVDRSMRHDQAAAALQELRAAADVPLLKAHLCILEAQFFFLENELTHCQLKLKQAESIAFDTNNPWVLFESYRLRARIHTQKGEVDSANTQALLAFNLAQAMKWAPRQQSVAKEFRMHHEMGSVPTKLSRGYRESSSTFDFKDRRYLDALLELSQINHRLTNAEEHSGFVLLKILKLLGAERAFLFLKREGNNSLYLAAGRRQDGTPILEARAYSTRIVEEVKTKQEPMVVSGTDQGAALGSHSAVIHDLRSIMAAPLIISNELVGVIYLDTRVAKGVFTQNEITILNALSTHIAISITTARQAQLEIEKEMLARDLELTGVVQSLLLPKDSYVHNKNFSLESYYQPASQASGDWWWHESIDQDRDWVIVSDVTGHGAGSAMIASAFASSYRSCRQLSPNISMEAIIQNLHKNLKSLALDRYWVSASFVEIDRKLGLMTWWNASCPNLVLLRNGSLQIIDCEASNALGSEEFVLAKTSVEIRPGDRVFVFTDGAYEYFLSDGRQFGEKAFLRLLSSSAGLPLHQVRDMLTTHYQQQKGLSADFRDDISIVAFEI